MINDNWIEIVEFLRTQEALSTTELKNQIILLPYPIILLEIASFPWKAEGY